jgi:hypothetical protein
VHSKAAVNGSATKKMKAKSKQKGHGKRAQHCFTQVQTASKLWRCSVATVASCT